MPVEITVTIPDEHIQRAKAALDFIDSKTIDISIGDNLTGINYGFAQTIEKGGLNNGAYAKKVIMDLLRTLVRAYEFGTDRERYQTDVSNVTLPSQNVPDEIIG